MKKILLMSLGLILLTYTILPLGINGVGSEDGEITEPLAHITWKEKKVGNILYFSLSASSSLDPDHIINSYEWVLEINGTTIGEYYSPFFIIELEEDGYYNITLTIRTENNYSDTVDMRINYEPSDDNQIIMGVSVKTHIEVIESLRGEKQIENENKWYEFSSFQMIIISVMIIVIISESITIFFIRRKIKR